MWPVDKIFSVLWQIWCRSFRTGSESPDGAPAVGSGLCSNIQVCSLSRDAAQDQVPHAFEVLRGHGT